MTDTIDATEAKLAALGLTEKFAKNVAVAEEQREAAINLAEEECRSHQARAILEVAQEFADGGLAGEELSEKVHAVVKFVAEVHRDAVGGNPLVGVYAVHTLYGAIKNALSHDEGGRWSVEWRHNAMPTEYDRPRLVLA